MFYENQTTWFLLSLSITMTMIDSVSADWSHSCSLFNHRKGVCGSQLDELLESMCIFGYNWQGRRRREAEPDTSGSLQNILIPQSEANSYLGREKRSAFMFQGIVCECCINSCSVSELRSYCRNEPDHFWLFKRSIDRQLTIRNRQ